MLTNLIPSRFKKSRANMLFSNLCVLILGCLLYFPMVLSEIISNKLIRRTPSAKSVSISSIFKILSFKKVLAQRVKV